MIAYSIIDITYLEAWRGHPLRGEWRWCELSPASAGTSAQGWRLLSKWAARHRHAACCVKTPHSRAVYVAGGQGVVCHEDFWRPALAPRRRRPKRQGPLEASLVRYCMCQRAPWGGRLDPGAANHAIASLCRPVCGAQQVRAPRLGRRHRPRGEPTRGKLLGSICLRLGS